MSVTENQIKLITEAWSKANFKAYVCPLFQVHSRAFVFPNKVMWESHLIQDHTEKELEYLFDLKFEFLYQQTLYSEYIAEQEAKESIEETKAEVQRCEVPKCKEDAVTTGNYYNGFEVKTLSVCAEHKKQEAKDL